MLEKNVTVQTITQRVEKKRWRREGNDMGATFLFLPETL